jgi:hypothetical protein
LLFTGLVPSAKYPAHFFMYVSDLRSALPRME